VIGTAMPTVITSLGGENQQLGFSYLITSAVGGAGFESARRYGRR